MRIKFLSVIVSFLFVSFAMSSCLGDDDPIEYSPNALVQAFELDNILGVNYAFTIDQLSGRIYNQDSLPVGSDTIIDRILIKTLSTAGYVVAVDAAGKDSLFNIEDSVNLVNTMEILPDGTSGKPFKFRVYAPDLEQERILPLCACTSTAAGFPELGRRSDSPAFCTRNYRQTKSNHF